MKHIKENNNSKIMNWKQFNAIKSDKEDYNDYSKHKEREDKAYNHPLYKTFFNEITQNYPKEYDMYHKVYFKPMLFLGGVIGYKNCYLDYINLSFNDPFSFHIKFEIENPNILKIQEIDKKLKELDSLGGEKWNEYKDEYNKLYKEKNELDKYISDFSYCYIQELPQDKLDDILQIIKNSDTKSNSDKMKELKEKKQKMLNILVRNDETKEMNELEEYQYKLAYWNLLDEYEDLESGKTPNEKELKEREGRNNKPFEKYKEEQDYIKKTYFSK